MYGQWRMYLEFSRKSFQRAAIYRFDAWTRILANVMFLFMWGFIWYGLYRGKEAAEGITFDVMLSYILISQMLQAVHSAGTPLWEIQERVRSGDIAMELMRPFDYPLRVLFSDLGSVAFHLLTAVLPLYLTLFWFFAPLLPQSPSQWLAFLVSALFGYLIRYSIELTFGLFTFWLIETGGVEDVFYFSISLLSGSVVPLWFFPDWLETVARYLPFQGIFFVPNAIFVGELRGEEMLAALATQFVWVLITYAILRLTWKRAARKVVVQGG
ncbi:ABC-2 family transporter protein [Bacillaceae bacterium]